MSYTSYMPRVKVFGCDDSISKSHCQKQLAMLIAEYETMVDAQGMRPQADTYGSGAAAAVALTPAARTAREIATKYAGQTDTDVSWTMVLKFHRCVLSLLPMEELKRAAWTLRERYRETFGEREYSDYLASKPADLADKDCPRETLLADMDTLLEKTYGNYAMDPENAWLLRRRVRATMITIGIALTALGISLALAFPNHVVGATLLTVCFSGSIGGFVSVLQRLRQLGGSGDALTDYHEIQSVRFTTIFASGVTGVLFAAVLYLLFAGGLIQGTMFPDLTPPSGQGQEVKLSAAEPQIQKAANAPTSVVDIQRPAAAITPEPAHPVQAVFPGAGATQRPQSTVYSLVAERHPHTARDVALLVIWAFLAGFFERLVPDNLNRLLAKKAELQA